MSKSKTLKSVKDETESEDKKHQIIVDFSDLFEELSRAPKMDELCERGHTKDSVKHHFSSLGKLEEEARVEFPHKFFDVEIADLMDEHDLSDKLHKVVKQYKKFVITTAVTGCAVHSGFHASLKSFCKQNKAALLILVASDPAHNKTYNRGGYGTIDQRLAKDCLVVESKMQSVPALP